MVIGKNKAMKKLLAELERKPLTLYGKRLKVVELKKYLGDNLAKNLSQSVLETVKKRSINDEARADTIGRLNVCFTIWESVCIPTLLHNAEVWVKLPKKALNLLEKNSS